MIESIQFANFKSWGSPPPMRFGRITGLFGSNSSGKSSVLQVLLLFKQTAESLDRSRTLHLGDERTPVDLGTFYDIVRDHQIGRGLQFDLRWRREEPLRVLDPARRHAEVLSSDELRFSVVVDQVGEGEAALLSVDRMSYGLGRASFSLTRREDDTTKYDLKAAGFDLRRKPGRPWPLPSPIKSYGFPDQVANYYQNADFLSDLSLAFDELMSSLSYVGPLRENPHRTYLWGGERPAGVGFKGERAVEALLAARAENRKIGRGEGRGKRYVLFETRIANWLQEMDLIESFQVRQIARNRKEYEVRVRKTNSSPEVFITDVGFGVSQVLPVLVQCCYAPEGSVIIFEQPEIHLHPRVQAALADVFIDTVIERNVQILVESHSEHLLRRLQRRIAEERLPNDEIALYFTRLKDGASELVTLDLDMFGNIRNWPEDFFGDELGELTAMYDAATQRVASG